MRDAGSACSGWDGTPRPRPPMRRRRHARRTTRPTRSSGSWRWPAPGATARCLRPDMPEGHVLILTPVKDASPSLAMYFSALSTLSYPGELISLGFLESDSRDDTYELLLRQTAGLAGRYRSIGVWKRDFG